MNISFCVVRIKERVFLTRYKEKLVYTLYFLLVFGFLLTVFLKIHPLVLFNSDDWLYASYDRLAVPLWKEWNPCRILPETLMSWCTYFCAYVLMPVFRLGFMDATVIGYGILYSVFILIYFFLFVRFLKKKYSLSLFQIISVSFLFFLLHFMVFLRYISGDLKNQHMFMASYTTCYFYYAIPNLWNAGLVFFFLTSNVDSHIKKRHYTAVAIIVLAVYLAVFSDLFQTIILISFMSYKILVCFIRQIPKNKKQIFRCFYTTIRYTFFYCCALVIWLISLVFEYNGGRSRMVNDASWQSSITESVKVFLSFFSTNLSKLFIVSFIGIFVLATIVFLVKRKQKSVSDKLCIRYFLCFLYCLAVTSVFEILLASRTALFYLLRADVMFGCMLYILLLFIVMLVYVLQNIRIFTVFLPLYLYIAVSFSVFFSHNYYVTSSNNVDYKTCKEIGEYIVTQIVDADRKAQKTVTVHVPRFADETNYPINTVSYEYTTYSFGYIVSDTLYKCDVIHRPIVVTIQPDETLNTKFHLTT